MKKGKVLEVILYVIAGIHAIGGFALLILSHPEHTGTFRLLCFYVSLFGLVLGLSVRATTLYHDLTSKLKQFDLEKVSKAFEVYYEYESNKEQENEVIKNNKRNPEGRKDIPLG